MVRRQLAPGDLKDCLYVYYVLEKVREGSRRLERVEEGRRRLKKVEAGRRR